jgi:hypothetical protein
MQGLEYVEDEVLQDSVAVRFDEGQADLAEKSVT